MMTRPLHHRKTTLALIFVLLTLAVVGCAPSTKLQREFYRPTRIGPAYRKVFDKHSESIPERMKEHRIPGLSIAVVDREGILWTAGFGRTGRGKQPVTPETLFSIQSMSKTFTAVAVMIAVQDGLVDLDTPIATYLPEFTVNSRWEDNPQQKITLRHLLSHTAGFTHEAPVGNNLDTRYDSFEQHVLSISDTWFRHRVGAKYSYSNLGIDLAAYILQVKSGMPFTEYMKQKVFDPLGMPTSSIDYDFVEQFPDRALGHAPFIAKVPVAIPMIAAGGVYTSAAELSRFVQFHLNRGKIDGRRILDASLVDTMDTSPEVSKGYGLGIAIGEKHDTYYLNHNGGGFGFLTTMTWYPEYGIGCVVLTNGASHDSQNARIADEILDELITKRVVAKDISDIPPADRLIGKDAKLPVLAEEGPVHTATPYKPEWKRYAGTYRHIAKGYQLSLIVHLVLALGYCDSGMKLTVIKKDGFLCIGDDKLEEFQPGLFFTPSGETLDLRDPVPTWRNIKLEKSNLFWSL
ncbi:serine hydrolase domain-containing protein [Planctomycetota bacterium]